MPYYEFVEPKSEKPRDRFPYSDDEIKSDPKGVLVIVMDAEKKSGSFDYSFRRRILALSNGVIKTYQAFVKDSWVLEPDPKGEKYEETEKYLDDDRNWLEERIAFHHQVVNRAFSLGVELSRRVMEKSGDKEPTVFMVRGNIGAGKTQALRTHPMFQALLDDNQEPTGVVSPDNLKSEIREDMGKNEEEYILSHFQCHSESLVVERKLQAKLFSEPDLSMAFDERFAYMDRIEKLVGIAIKYRRKIKILDLDVPLEVSIIRNLKREPNGKDPCVPYGDIRDGFVKIRETREKLLRLVDLSQVTYYLLSESKSTPLKDVAEKTEGDFRIIMPGLFEKLRKIGTTDERELSRLDNQMIDNTFIDHIQHLLDQQSFTLEEKKRIIEFLEKHPEEKLVDVVNNRAK